MQHERLEDIDVAKGIGILLVVACHANFAPLSPGRFFHMPLFFFLTGYLSSYEAGLGSLIARKLRSLYVPFVAMELVWIVTNPLWVRMGISSELPMPLWQQLVHVALGDNIAILLAPIWFLTVLFWVNIIAWLWGRLRAKCQCLWPVVAGSAVLAIVGVVATRLGWLRIEHAYNLHEGLNVTLVAQFFCVLGYAMRQIDWKATQKWWCFLALVWLYVAKLLLGLAVDMRANHYSPWWLFLPTALAGIYATMYVAGYLTRTENVWLKGLKNALAYGGQASLYILLLHIFSFKLVGWLQAICLGMQGDNSGWTNPGCTGVWTIVYTIVGILLPMGIYALIASGKAYCASKRTR